MNEIATIERCEHKEGSLQSHPCMVQAIFAKQNIRHQVETQGKQRIKSKKRVSFYKELLTIQDAVSSLLRPFGWEDNGSATATTPTNRIAGSGAGRGLRAAFSRLWAQDADGQHVPAGQHPCHGHLLPPRQAACFQVSTVCPQLGPLQCALCALCMPN